MGKLSIEEKAKRFDEALAMAKECITYVPDKTVNKYMLNMFPELKESEDERIRKRLIEKMRHFQREAAKDCDADFDFAKSAIAWLEKQGEQNKKEYSVWVGGGEVNDFLLTKEAAEKIAEEYRKEGYDDVVIEKQGEQKPIFRVDDWIVNNGHSYLIAHIDYEQRRYLFEIGGYTHEQLNWEYIETADNKYHLWTIQDAKDGDVLVASDGSIFLFKGVVDGIMVKHYVALTTDNTVKFNEGLKHYWEVARAVKPATKEQRDLLFQKMKEVGYAWDAEKKELKPYMIQWKGDNLKEVIDFTGKSKNFDKWFKSFEEYEKYVNDHDGIFKMFYEDGSHYEVPVGAWIVKTPDGYNVASKATFIQKSTWSEEDEKMCKDTIQFIETGWSDYGKSHLIPWLKDLKERM